MYFYLTWWTCHPTRPVSCPDSSQVPVLSLFCLLFLIFIDISSTDKQLSLMTWISESIRDWFPSYCFRLCNLCLKEKQIFTVVLGFSISVAPRHYPICAHVSQLHKQIIMFFFPFFPQIHPSQFKSYRCSIFPDSYHLQCLTIIEV